MLFSKVTWPRPPCRGSLLHQTLLPTYLILSAPIVNVLYTTYFTALTLFDTGAYTSFVNREVAKWLEQLDSKEDMADMADGPMHHLVHRIPSYFGTLDPTYLDIQIHSTEDTLEEKRQDSKLSLLGRSTSLQTKRIAMQITITMH